MRGQGGDSALSTCLRFVLLGAVPRMGAQVTAFSRCKHPRPSLEKGGLRGEPSLTARPLAFWSKVHMQGGPASVVKVLLSENQPLTAIEGAPKNHEKNTNSCK